MEKEKLALEAITRQLFASVVWSHKIQCKQADIYKKRFNILNIIIIIASALTTAGIFSVIFADEKWIKIISAVFSFIVTAISTFLKTFELSNLAKEHMKTANELWYVREQLLMLLVEISSGKKDYDTLMITYREIQQDLKKVYDNSPTTQEKAVSMAKKALKIDGDYTYTDEEIDSFLPVICKKTTASCKSK